MKAWICKHKKLILLACHLLALPAAWLVHRLSEQMLRTNTVCSWLRIGAKCPTCGGTHFVNALLQGDLTAALEHNAFLFLLALFFAVSLILLDLAVWLELPFAKKVLRKLYTYSTLVFFCVLLVLFVILRNWHIWLLPFQSVG